MAQTSRTDRGKIQEYAKTRDVKALPGSAQGLSRSGREALTKNPMMMPSMKKGGIVKKTGPHKLHKGEKVVPAKKKKR